MKKYFCIMFSLLILTVSAVALASNNAVTLINKGETITTTNSIIKQSDNYFISIDDLNLINLGYVQYGESRYGLGRLNGDYKCLIYTDTGILDYEKNYENAVIVENNIVYVSLNCLIDIYSENKETNIDTENDILTFWINDYKTTTYWITYEIDNSIPIDENGLDVTLYRGFISNSSDSSGGGNPELFYGEDLTAYPSKTDVFNMGRNHSIISSENHIFYDNARTYTIHYDSSDENTYRNRNTAGIKADNDIYIGGTYEILRQRETIVTLTYDDVIEYVTISGTISIPVHTQDVEYTVIAESDFVDMKSGTISAGETDVSYELKLKPDLDYKVYIRFRNGEYIRQSVDVENITSNKTVNFNNFTAANEITGTIKLPTDISCLTDVYSGKTIETLHGTITLQGAEEPHYIVNKKSIDLIISDGYADFILRDDVGLESAIVSFRFHNSAKEIYEAGVYYDNSTIKYVAEEGRFISTNTKDIALNIVKGKLIETVIDYTAQNYTVGDNYILIQDDSENKLGYDSCPMRVHGGIISRNYDVDNVNCRVTYNAVIPCDKSDYISCLLMSYDDEYPLYYNEKTKTWQDDLFHADIITSTTLAEMFDGYKPVTAVKIKGDLDETELVYHANFATIGDFDYKSATRYIAYYGEDNDLIYIDVESKDYYARKVLYENIKLDNKYYPLAKTIKMFIWTDSLQHLSKVMYIKQI